MFDETLTFPSSEEMRRPIEDGTIANVAIRKNKDGERVVQTGESQYGPYFILSCEVVDGEHKGDWASSFVNVKPTDRKFRSIFEVVTGTDLSAGGEASWPQFEEKLLSGIFSAELGPERKKRREGDDQNYLRALESGKTGEAEVGELYTTGYTTIRKLIERSGEFAGGERSEADKVPATVGPADDGDYGSPADEDLPF